MLLCLQLHLLVHARCISAALQGKCESVPLLGKLRASNEHLCGDLLLSASFALSFVHVICNKHANSYHKQLLFISRSPF